MKELYGKEYSCMNQAHATWQFANEMQIGDIVYVKKGMYKIIGRGIVESDYTLDQNQIMWSAIKYHRNNATYKMLMNICYLVIKGLLPNESSGSRRLAKYLDDQQMHSLYQRFVLEYYRKHYPEYKVTAAQIDWDVDDGIVDFLPAMKSDITIEFNDQTLIIDTKYYAHTMQTNSLYNSRSNHSGNLYQIFTYVKNRDTANSGKVSGVLLYAKTDEEITPDNYYLMSGNRISVKTLDLNTEFENIKEQLNAWLRSFYRND